VTGLQAIVIASVALAAGSAVLAARRRADHRPAAAALCILLVANLAAIPLASNALLPPHADPWGGWMRVLVYLDGAVQLSSDATVAGLALAITVNRPKRAVAAVAGVWALASVALAMAYPSPMVRGASLQKIYFAADLAGVLVAFGTIGSWIFQRKAPRPVLWVATLITLSDLAVLLDPLSPWRGAQLVDRYEFAQVMLILLYVSLAIYQGVLWVLSTK